MIPQWEQDIINSKVRKYVYVIEWLDKNEQSLGEVTLDVISGSINFDSTSNNRRSCNITLKNLNGEYLPSHNSKMWIQNKVRIKSGYIYGDNQQLLYNQGIYVLGNPSMISNPIQKEVSLQLLDKWVTLDGSIAGKLKNKYIIPLGTRIDEAVKSLIVDVAGETKYIIDECNINTPYTIEKEATNTVADILIELANIVSFNIYYDNEGFLRFRKALQPEDYNTMPVDWYYTTENLYLESTRELKWNECRNSIIVYGMTDSDSNVQYYATAQDLTGSELSIDKIGERVDTIEDSNIFSNELCQIRAEYELLQRIQFAENVNANIIPNFSHNLENIINLVDVNNGSEGNYILQSISYNLGFDTTMALGLWKIRDWR